MGNILGVDRGTKYVGLSYRNEKSNMVMPIGYVMNDPHLFFNMSDIVHRYFIKKLVVGYPKQHTDLQKKIDEFLENILFIDANIEIIKADEEYSSVQAGERSGNFKKNEGEDTLAAMVILENFLSKN